MSDIAFDEGQHKYVMDGTELPSVTTILGDCGCFPQYYSSGSAAANRGTIIHKLFRDFLRNQLDYSNVQSEGLALIEGLQGILPDIGSILDTEKIMATCWNGEVLLLKGFDKYGYAGTIDALTESTVIEWKTGQQERWHHLQVAAYCYLAKKHAGSIVYIDKGFEIIQVENIDKLFTTFLEMLDIYNWKRAK